MKQGSKVALAIRIAVAGAMIGAIGAALVLPLGAANASKVTTFLGRFHILALHVPIGILVLALTAEACTLVRRGRRHADVVVVFALPLLVATGFAAILLGLMLAHGGHYPHKLVAPHRNLTIIGIFIAGIATLHLPRRRTAGRWVHRGILGASALALMIGAHFGGSMTHGEDYLFASVEDPQPAVAEDPDAGATELDAGVRVTVVPALDAAAASVLDASAPDAAVEAGAPAKPSNRALAQAMINRRCAPCHTTGSKGGLRLGDITKPLKKGALVPGAPESSTLYTRLVLPADDDDHMPPIEKSQPTKGEIALMRAWIAEQK